MAAFVLATLENGRRVVVVSGVAMKAQVIGDEIGQTLADDLGGLFMQVPDVIGINQRVDLVTQGQVGVVNRQLDVGALSGNGFLNASDVPGAFDNGVDLFFGVTARLGGVGLVVPGFGDVHGEIADLRVQIVEHFQGRSLVQVGRRLLVSGAGDFLSGFFALTPDDPGGHFVDGGQRRQL